MEHYELVAAVAALQKRVDELEALLEKETNRVSYAGVNKKYRNYLEDKKKRQEDR